MFSIPILIQDEIPFHLRRPRHPCSAQLMCQMPAQWSGSFQDFTTIPYIQPVWMFQPDAFPCSPSPRPCRSRSPQRPKEEHSDFTQRLITDLFGDLFLTGKEEAQTKQKNKDACRRNVSKSDARKPSGEQSTNEVVDNMIDEMKEFYKPQNQRFDKWHHIVDCSGFKSENIYVNVLDSSIIVRGEKEEQSENGTVSVTSIEKCIKIPQNLETKNISCSLLHNSRLLIEAPYINKKNGKETSSTKPLSESCKFLQYSYPFTLHYTKDNSDSDKELRKMNSSITPREDKSEEAESNFKPEDIENDDQQGNKVEDNDDDGCSPTSYKSDESFVLISEKENKDEICALDESKIKENKVNHDEQHEIYTENSDKICNTPNETDLHSLSKTSDLLKKTDETTLSASGKDEDAIPTRYFQVRLELMCHSPDSIRVTIDDKTRHINILSRRDNGNSNESVLKEVSVPEIVDVANLRCYFQDGLLTIAAPFKTPVTGTRDIPITM